MNTLTVENKWSEISQEIGTDFKAIRISDDCIPDLYLSYNAEGDRCLILSTPPGFSVDFKDETREYISIRYFDKSRHTIIQLTEKRFNDVFNALIISVYFRIKSIKNPDQASAELLRVYHEWSEFFSELTENRLSFNELLGLIGEIFVLNRLIKESPSEGINDILNSWTGPYDKGHDFSLAANDIEVKTKEVSKIDVAISSEFQLEAVHGKGLRLTIISVLVNVEDAKTLKTMIFETKDHIISKLGELSIFFKAIARKGLTMMNLTEYDNYEFKVHSEISYDCTADGFPRLSVSNIPKEIKSVRFTLILNTLNDYIIEQIEY